MQQVSSCIRKCGRVCLYAAAVAEGPSAAAGARALSRQMIALPVSALECRADGTLAVLDWRSGRQVAAYSCDAEGRLFVCATGGPASPRDLSGRQARSRW